MPNADLPSDLPVEQSSLFLGDSSAARHVRDLIFSAAATRAPVLITGESGVGKELVAREIHLRSNRFRGGSQPVRAAEAA